MKVWIDLANSPHPLLFAPLVERFEELGVEVVMSARDNAQTVELARRHLGKVVVVGGPSPAGRPAKAAAIASRTAALVRCARAWRPDVALSHNSYAQLVAAAALRIPSVTAMDYEHQPANHLAFRLAHRVLLPAALPQSAVASQGASARKVVSYPGLKEELYAGRFQPDPAILETFGLDPGAHGVLVVARTPPTGASYHRLGNPRFGEALRMLSERDELTCVVLARFAEQAAEIDAMRLHGVITPRHAVDSRSLIVAADAFLGAGGTMTREAAVLGVPTYSMFAGRRPLVDAWLEQEGAIRRVDTVAQLEELARLGPREPAPLDLNGLRERARAIEDVFVATTLEVGGSRRP
jgi:predicted glycosyltransferase